ncbi:MAG: PUA domain-containing protein [Candidatus Bathyarchaeota archaeon B23]|nr:MAG: PUA domain-containing protein [Candidatus Bathyarchaeota archaeon B23]
MKRRELRRLREEAGGLLPEAETVEEAEMEDGTVVYLIDDSIVLAKREGVLFPTLKSHALEALPSIVVDMGAIPHICNGADVMAPGVVEVQGEFQPGDLVVVRDERYGKALAVGRALVGSEELRSLERGRVVKNLHYVGDRLWRAG